jgi:mono/diheme cytochrome c family protein
MRVRSAVIAPACLVSFLVSGFVLGVPSGPASAQEDQVARGHGLATLICSACHVAAPDQNFEPILRPPAPPFASIAQRNNVTADFLRTFLTTTHRDISSPNGMPNPQLLDYQIEDISAYILSLRKRS